MNNQVQQQPININKVRRTTPQMGMQQQTNQQQMAQQQMNQQQINAGYDANINNYQNNSPQYNGYEQQMSVQKATYNNELNKNGKYGFNLMIYVLIASLLFMGGLTQALVILFAIVFIAEKDSQLNKVIITILFLDLALFIGYRIIYELLTPFNRLGDTIINHAIYDGIVYKIGRFISSGILTLKSILSWVYDIGIMIIGALQFNNVRKGKFKVPKIIDKYLN